MKALGILWDTTVLEHYELNCIVGEWDNPSQVIQIAEELKKKRLRNEVNSMEVVYKFTMALTDTPKSITFLALKLYYELVKITCEQT